MGGENMNKIKKWASAVLAAAMFFSLVGCGGEKGKDPNENGRTEETAVDIVKDGQTDYRILLPASPTDTESYAAGELSFFFSEATGISIATVSDDSVDADKNGKFLSIGDTELFEESGVEVSLSELGDDGFKVVTYGNCVLMNGADESGKIYSVYDFLEEQFNFEVYAADEIYIDHVENAKLKDLHITEFPDFEGRDVNAISVVYNPAFATRKRLRGATTTFLPTHGSGSAWSPTLWCHSTHILLPPSLYLADHDDWYGGSNNLALCYGTGISDTESGRLMRQTLIESLKSYIQAAPKAKFFMIGLEDNCGECGCDLCVEANKIYGGEYERMSGPMVVFVNMIAREIKAWLQETAPERAELVKIGLFAYQASEQPPVTWNEETGNYECADAVKPESNVFVRLAPLSSVYSKSFMDEEANRNIREVILGWYAMGAQLSVWSYSCPFGAYLYPFYGWHVFQENYRIFLEYGVTDILDQGPRDSSVLPFHAMRDYVLSELMWDVDQDVNVLIDNFMDNYFKDAAPFMKEYFYLINANYALMEKTQGYKQYAGAWESRDNALAKYYPKSYLNRCLEIFDRAYEAIAAIEDEATRNIVLMRVQKEELSPRYINIEHYLSTYYDESEQRALIAEFQADANRLGLNYYAEDGLINNKYQNWQNSLL